MEPVQGCFKIEGLCRIALEFFSGFRALGRV